jgi:transposase-like protein
MDPREGVDRWENNDGSLKRGLSKEVESGLLSVSAASRKYQISGSVIDRWRRQAKQGVLEAAPSVREKFLERENRELKERLAELYLENDHLKKFGDWLRRHKNGTTSVITAESLARLPKGPKS